MKRPILSFLQRLRRQAGPLLLLLVLVQAAMVAHRIEHYVAPDQVEDIATCAAFSPTPDVDVEPPVIVRQPHIYAVRTVWAPVQTVRPGEIDQHAYRSQAPPA